MGLRRKYLHEITGKPHEAQYRSNADAQKHGIIEVRQDYIQSPSNPNPKCIDLRVRIPKCYLKLMQLAYEEGQNNIRRRYKELMEPK